MEQICDYRRWAPEKTRFQPVTNLCLLPGQLQNLSETGRLRGSKCGTGMVLLVDEGEYDALYFHLEGFQPLYLPEQKKPYMAELLYRTDREGEIEEAERLLQASGFFRRTRCIHFTAPLCSIEPEEHGIILAQATHLNAVRGLWEQHLSCYDFHEDSRARLAKLIEQNKICCALNNNGDVCGAMMLDIQQRRLSCRHLVVHPDYRGKGLGQKILHFAFAHGLKLGCRTASHWVAEDNLPSVAMHRKLMKQTNRMMAQYVLEKRSK